MSRRTVWLEVETTSTTIWLLLVTLTTLAGGFPVARNDGVDSSAPLPFLQFTNGGIRVNFGGYHAQAGLGGLLTGSSKDGGLHASAGTPSGAHASAGLGGNLNAGPAGGLHARAGLGNGGPEAEAGLAGSIIGPRPQGTLYADSSPGNFALLDENNKIEKSKHRGKNVQIIPRSKKATQQELSPGSSALIENSSISSNYGGKETERIQHPARWYFRKRLHERVGSATSKTSYNAIASPPDHAEAVAAAATATIEDVKREPPVKEPQTQQGIFTRSTAETNTSATGISHKYKSSTLFDDIFNIPISALNAVNQLLKNHVGRK